MSAEIPSVFYDPVSQVLHVRGLKSSDVRVVAEASRWTTGERGEPVAVSELAGVDLTVFAREALSVGARVLSIVAQDGETAGVRQAVSQASTEVTEALDRATRAADESVQRAAETMRRASDESRRQVAEQMTTLLGGESPELLERLRPLLESVSVNLETHARAAVETANQTWRAETKQHTDKVIEMLHEVRREVAVKVASDETESAVKTVTTIKGFDYEDLVHLACEEVADSIGEDYRRTGQLAGRFPRNMKGDGVFHVSGDLARIVVEAHDGSAKEWGSYLEEAERNRGAAASLGLVRRVEDNRDQRIRVISPRRLVLAYDPGQDEPWMLHATVLLMRTVALSSGGRSVGADVSAAAEAVRDAIERIEKLDEVTKSARLVRTHAEKIEQAIAATVAGLNADLNRATNALTGATVAAQPEPPADEPDDSDAPHDVDGEPGTGLRALS